MMLRKSNAETAQENYDVFFLWRKGKKLEQLVPYLARRKNGDVIEHKLNRSRINNEVKIGAAINQHPIIRKELAELDDQLLKAGLREPDVPVSSELVAPDEADASTAIQPVQGGLSAADRRRLNELEEENAYLREELKEKNAALKRYGLIDRFLTDTMRLPR
jgi:hypothetical protein